MNEQRRDAYFRDYRDEQGVGYVIEIVDGDRYTWTWVEPPWEPDTSYSSWDDLADALRDAAQDWEDNGNPTPRRSAILRSVATRLDRS